LLILLTLSYSVITHDNTSAKNVNMFIPFFTNFLKKHHINTAKMASIVPEIGFLFN